MTIFDVPFFVSFYLFMKYVNFWCNHFIRWCGYNDVLHHWIIAVIGRVDFTWDCVWIVYLYMPDNVMGLKRCECYAKVILIHVQVLIVCRIFSLLYFNLLKLLKKNLFKIAPSCLNWLSWPEYVAIRTKSLTGLAVLKCHILTFGQLWSTKKKKIQFLQVNRALV